jgi:hypothetical protein
MNTLARNLCLLAALTVVSVTAADTQIGGEDDDLGNLPKVIRQAAGDPGKGCHLRGKPIAVRDRPHTLWFVASTCGGSAGQPMFLVYQTRAAKLVLAAGTTLSMKIADELNHGLPDVITEYGDNCCGFSSTEYRFDGNEYQDISHAQTGDFNQFTGLEVPPDVKAVIGDYGANEGCTLSGGPITVTDRDAVALLVVSSCGDSNDIFPVWVVMLTPTPRVILQDRSSDSLDLGPQQFRGQPDICLGDGGQKCWHFDGKTYVRK